MLITSSGNDEREHPFLVKGGEDLRLDQRIEQLFRIMNDILARDSACCRRGLGLKCAVMRPLMCSSAAQDVRGRADDIANRHD